MDAEKAEGKLGVALAENVCLKTGVLILKSKAPLNAERSDRASSASRLR